MVMLTCMHLIYRQQYHVCCMQMNLEVNIVFMCICCVAGNDVSRGA